jgi:hypothetical protein
MSSSESLTPDRREDFVFQAFGLPVKKVFCFLVSSIGLYFGEGHGWKALPRAALSAKVAANGFDLAL